VVLATFLYWRACAARWAFWGEWVQVSGIEVQTDNPREIPHCSCSRLLLIVSVVLLVQVPGLFEHNVDLRNYVIGRYDANSNEMRLAEKRASLYWQKNGNRIGEKGHYLAIEAASLMPGDVVQPL